MDVALFASADGSSSTGPCPNTMGPTGPEPRAVPPNGAVVAMSWAGLVGQACPRWRTGSRSGRRSAGGRGRWKAGNVRSEASQIPSEVQACQYVAGARIPSINSSGTGVVAGVTGAAVWAGVGTGREAVSVRKPKNDPGTTATSA